MSGKKLLVIMGVLGLVSFATAFVLTQMFRTAPEVRKTEEMIRQEQADRAALAGVETLKLGPREIELEKLIKELKRKRAELHQRTRNLEQREKRIQVAINQLKAEAAELETLRVQLAAPLVRLNELKQGIDKTRVMIAQSEDAKLKALAKTFAAMPPESSGGIITSMCADERIDHAAKIVWYMNDRDRAKLLAAITDAKVTGMLLERFTKIQQEKG